MRFRRILALIALTALVVQTVRSLLIFDKGSFDVSANTMILKHMADNTLSKCLENHRRLYTNVYARLLLQ